MQKNNHKKIISPPVGLAIFAILGPSIVWCSEYIGSGEVILATRTGAILGTGIMWAVVIGVLLKFWIGMSGAHYTVCTGEGMIDMFGRIPGPKNWPVWIILVAQFVSGAIGMSGVASASAIFVSELTHIDLRICGLIIVVFAVFVTWSGKFEWLKYIMSIFVFLIILGVFNVVVQVFPGFNTFISGFVPSVPVVPQWAIAINEPENPWKLILPLIGWGAGGFASQVFYTYWIIGAGYGLTEKDVYGKPSDLKRLKSLSISEAGILKKWTKVVYFDAFIAVVLGTGITLGFVLAGAEILGPLHLAPKGNQVAFELTHIFSRDWGKIGALLFLIGGTAALVSTLVGQMAGWPRLVSDAFRLCFPKVVKDIQWKWQFRITLLLFLITNSFIVYVLGKEPVFLLTISSILDGVVLTAFQAILILIGLYYVMPKMFTVDVYKIIKPKSIIFFILIITFMVFSYFSIFQVPKLFFN